MKISLTGNGLLDPNSLRGWTNEQNARIRRGVAEAMRSVGRDMAKQANQAAARNLHIKRRNVPGIYAKVYEQKPTTLPALQIASKIPWLGLHEHGGSISGKMLIPFGNQRIGFKKWQAIVRNLLASGNAFFKQVRGKVLLFAENIQENAKELSRFKRVIRTSLGGGRIKRGAEIPIAILVTRVTLKKRLGMEQSVRASLPQLTARIQRSL